MRIAISVLIVIGLANPAWSDMLVEYDISGNSSAFIPASLHVDYVSASSLTASGVGVLTNYGQGIFVASAWSESSTRDMSQFYQWDVSAEPGQAIGYSSIDMSLTRGHYQSHNGAETWQLYASTDAFASSEILLNTWDISLLGVLPETVTFRLYGFNANHAGQSGDYCGLAYAHNDLTGVGTNLAIYGQSVPEPATAALLCIGGLSLLWRRRTA